MRAREERERQGRASCIRFGYSLGKIGEPSLHCGRGFLDGANWAHTIILLTDFDGQGLIGDERASDGPKTGLDLTLELEVRPDDEGDGGGDEDAACEEHAVLPRLDVAGGRGGVPGVGRGQGDVGRRGWRVVGEEVLALDQVGVLHGALGLHTAAGHETPRQRQMGPAQQLGGRVGAQVLLEALRQRLQADEASLVEDAAALSRHLLRLICKRTVAGLAPAALLQVCRRERHFGAWQARQFFAHSQSTSPQWCHFPIPSFFFINSTIELRWTSAGMLSPSNRLGIDTIRLITKVGVSTVPPTASRARAFFTLGIIGHACSRPVPQRSTGAAGCTQGAGLEVRPIYRSTAVGTKWQRRHAAEGAAMAPPLLGTVRVPTAGALWQP